MPDETKRPEDPQQPEDLPPTDVTIATTRGGMTVPKPQYNPKELGTDKLKTEWITS